VALAGARYMTYTLFRPLLVRKMHKLPAEATGADSMPSQDLRDWRKADSFKAKEDIKRMTARPSDLEGEP
jgi:hypothetical protein